MAHLADADVMAVDAHQRRDDNWIQTFTGRQFWPLSPHVDDVDIRDIIHALALKCRFTGHCREFYSVAQHSVLVAQMLPPELKLWGLLHDASEAYLPDVARPVKRELVGFNAIEARVMRCIAERFSLSWPMPDEVHVADIRALATERRDLMNRPPRAWKSTINVEPWEDTITPLSPDDSKAVLRYVIDDAFRARSTPRG
jgi:hypothetical protein